jgi:RHS repeat-associated protein
LQFTYDEMDRVAMETLPDGEVLTYTYGEDGNLECINGEETYASDIEYTAYGNLKQICYGNGITTTYSYYDDSTVDPSNGYRTHSYRLREILVERSDGLDIAHATYEYNASDNLVKKTFTDDYNSFYTEEYTYDHFNRLVAAFSPELYGGTSYSYDSRNNIMTKDGRSYIYNAEIDGRTLPHAVSEVQDDVGNPLYTYEYDENGNMTAVRGQSKITIRAKGTGVAGNAPEMELWLAGEKQMSWTVTNTEYKEYTWYGYWDTISLVDIVFTNDNFSGGEETDLYIDWVEVNGVKKASEESNVQYDRGYYLAGCFDGTDIIPGQEQLDVTGALRFAFIGTLALDRTISYDYENRMTRIDDSGTIATFTYNAQGRRVTKSVNGVTTYYFFSSYEEVAAGGETRVLKYYFGPNGRIAQRSITDTGDELLFIHTDHLGSSVRMTDTSGEVVQSIAYDPFGKTVFTAGTKNPSYQFTDQEFDTEIGLYYYDARYYDPELGRFIQADKYLDSLNRYAYCWNNPVMYIDPTGYYTDYSDPSGPPGHYPGPFDYNSDPAYTGPGYHDNSNPPYPVDYPVYPGPYYHDCAIPPYPVIPNNGIGLYDFLPNNPQHGDIVNYGGRQFMWDEKK